MPGGYLLEREQDLACDPGDVFAFHADPANLEEITPPWLHFEILECSTPSIREGTLLRYRLRLHGVPVHWKTRIAAWDEPHGFVDEQVEGPYRLWVHSHRFVPIPGGVRVQDRVHYRVPGGRLVHELLVRRDLERIFDFRHERIARRFPGRRAAGGETRGILADPASDPGPPAKSEWTPAPETRRA